MGESEGHPEREKDNEGWKEEQGTQKDTEGDTQKTREEQEYTHTGRT